MSAAPKDNIQMDSLLAQHVDHHQSIAQSATVILLAAPAKLYMFTKITLPAYLATLESGLTENLGQSAPNAPLTAISVAQQRPVVLVRLGMVILGEIAQLANLINI